jgi:hypothetical protein
LRKGLIMTSRLAGTLAAAAVSPAGQCRTGGAFPNTSSPASWRRRVVGLLDSWRARALATWRSLRDRDGSWETVALEHYLRCSGDVHDLERRHRTWERDEVDAYRLSGWL